MSTIQTTTPCDARLVRLLLTDAAGNAAMAHTAADQLHGVLQSLRTKSDAACSPEQVLAYVDASLLVAAEALDTIRAGSEGCVDEINRVGAALFSAPIRPQGHHRQ
jgi:hypothetical protein